MDLFIKIIELLFIFLVPVLVIYLTKKFKFFKIVGPIIICYALGFILALINLPYDKSLSNEIASDIVPIAIPLILFTFSMKSVKKLARSTAISYALVCASVITVSVAAYFIAGDTVNNSAKLSAMAVGLYTGGTPNMLAIGSALNLSDAEIAAANTSDFFVGGVYLLFLYSVAGKVYGAILDKKKKKTEVKIKTETAKTEVQTDETPDFATEDYDFSALKGKNFWKVLLNTLLAVGCLAVGVLISWIVSVIRGEGTMFNSLIIILTVTALGIAFSFIPGVRSVKGTYQVGQYFILVFSLALAMSIDLGALAANMLPTLLYLLCIQTASILVHLILSKIFKIDSGTALITSVAGVYGPPFIAPVAQATNHREMIVPGVICGAIGLALGNFIGIGIGEILLLF